MTSTDAPATPAISIVMCTRNRAARLGSTLRSYERLDFDGPWELVVVMNGTTDATPQVVEEFRARTTLPMVVLDQPKPGLCAARNVGWRRSRGAVVAFVDDDCYPAADFLTELRSAFGDAAHGFVGGQMLLYDATDLPYLSIQADANRFELPPRSMVRAGLIHGGNMAFRRAVLESIGGFDERLGAGTPLMSGGDIDALSQASAAGYAGVYEPRVVVHHHHGRKTSEEGRRVMSGYDVGRGAFFVKCLLDPRRRGLYAGPILRRLAGHLARRRFHVLRSELRGAYRYLRSACTAGR